MIETKLAPSSIPSTGAHPRTVKKLSILFFGPTPPPYHGVSVLNEGLLCSRFTEVFNVVSIQTNFTSQISEIGKVRITKLLRLLLYGMQTFKAMLSRRYDFVCFPINFAPQAMMRDLFLLSCVALFRPKIIFYAHGNYLAEFRAQASGVMKKIMDFSMRLGDAAIVAGESLRSNFERYLPSERILMVPPGIEFFRNGNLGERNGSPLQILFLSHLSYAKGVDTVVEAIPKVVAKHQNVKFVFAGDWFDRNEASQVSDFIRDHRIGDFVEWRGPVAGIEKEQLYLSSHIFVFPTCFESFGLVNLEAMQAGLPIITTAQGEIPHVVKDGINGFVIQEQNSNELAERILQLCGDRTVREQMGMCNREKFWRQYTKEQYVDRMIAAFDRLHGLLG